MATLFLRTLLFAALPFSLFMAGCDSAAPSQGSANVRVHLTDFPLDLVSEANVTIDRVELIRADGGVEIIAAFDEPLGFNLLDLRDGVTALLGEKKVPGGTYTQLRIVVGEAAEVVLIPEGDDPARRFALRVPSGTSTGIKMNLPDIVVQEDDEVIEIVADFDVEQSFVVQGSTSTVAGIRGFIFKPVLRVEKLEVNGITAVGGE